MTRKRTRRQRRVLTNPIALATRNASLLLPHEIDGIIQPAIDALDALRERRALGDDWAYLASALGTANAIEEQGVVRGLMEQIHGIDDALVAIEKRATATGKWVSPTLYATEIEAIRLLIDVHRFQLQNLSHREFNEALNKFLRRAKAA